MGHTYVRNPLHVVFSTKERRPMSAAVPERLWPYMGGIARANGFRAIAVGGRPDHTHLLLVLPATMALAKAVQLIKGGSSKWVHETFPDERSFAWQEGYGAFGVSASLEEKTIRYIESQEAHHRHMTFEDEFLTLLRKHGVEYDPTHVFG